MAMVADTAKVFNFVVEVLGVNQFEIQKVTLPDMEIEAVKHGDTNHDIKTAGRVTVGDMVWEKLNPLPVPDSFAHDWLTRAQDLILGGGQLAATYKQTVVVKLMDSTGLVAVKRWLCTGCWISKLSHSDLDRMSSDNMIQSITLSVDTCIEL